MKIKKRKKIWESNSSSMHSVSISKSDSKGSLYPNDDGYVEVNSGEYGWGYEVLSTPREKLEYLVMMELEGTSATNEEEFIESDGFKEIEDTVKEIVDCKGIILEGFRMRMESYGEHSWLDHEGYIDHQSQCGSAKAFLEEYGLSIEEFLTNDGISVIIDNDN